MPDRFDPRRPIAVEVQVLQARGVGLGLEFFHPAEPLPALGLRQRPGGRLDLKVQLGLGLGLGLGLLYKH